MTNLTCLISMRCRQNSKALLMRWDWTLQNRCKRPLPPLPQPAASMRPTHLIQAPHDRDLSPTSDNLLLLISLKTRASSSIFPMMHPQCRCMEVKVDTRRTVMKILDTHPMAMPRTKTKDIPWNNHHLMTKTQMLFLTIRCRHHSVQVMTKSQPQFANTAVLQAQPQDQVPHLDLALALPLPNLCQQMKIDPSLSHMRS